MSGDWMFDPMASVMPRTHYEQNLGEYVRWHVHHIIWQGTPYDLRRPDDLFEDRHWADYTLRLDRFYQTGVFEKRFGG